MVSDRPSIRSKVGNCMSPKAENEEDDMLEIVGRLPTVFMMMVLEVISSGSYHHTPDRTSQNILFIS